MRTLHQVPIVLLTLLLGCFGSQDHRDQKAVTDVEREIDASLDGIEYRRERMRSARSSENGADQALDDLRRHRDELRMQLDELITERDAASDSTEHRLRDRMEDLAIRYEIARLGRFESRTVFEQVVEARFEDLDRELAVLEGYVLQAELRDPFDEQIARLYRLRNNVALKVAETAAATDDEFPRLKSELASAIGRLDIVLAHTTIEVDRAYEKKYPLRSLNQLWL